MSDFDVIRPAAPRAASTQPARETKRKTLDLTWITIGLLALIAVQNIFLIGLQWSFFSSFETPAHSQADYDSRLRQAQQDAVNRARRVLGQ